MSNAPPAITRLLMLRENLEAIPEFPVNEGYALRWYQPGDEAHWFDIHRLADQHNSITSETFAQQFGSDAAQLALRQCYLIDPDSHVIGTGTAWFDSQFDGTPIGRVHWVAIVPNYQGHGLSKSLMSAICTRLRELGHVRAYLKTSSARIRAIQLYLRFGFVPFIRDEAERALWREVTGLQSPAKLESSSPESE